MQTKDSLLVLQTLVHQFLFLHLHFQYNFHSLLHFIRRSKRSIFGDLLLTIKQKECLRQQESVIEMMHNLKLYKIEGLFKYF